MSFTLPEVVWTLIRKLPFTEVKFYPKVKSQTGLSSLRVSCKRALNYSKSTPLQKKGRGLTKSDIGGDAAKNVMSLANLVHSEGKKEEGYFFKIALETGSVTRSKCFSVHFFYRKNFCFSYISWDPGNIAVSNNKNKSKGLTVCLR